MNDYLQGYKDGLREGYREACKVKNDPNNPNDIRLLLLNIRLHALEEIFLKLHPDLKPELEEAVLRAAQDLKK